MIDSNSILVVTFCYLTLDMVCCIFSFVLDVKWSELSPSDSCHCTKNAGLNKLKLQRLVGHYMAAHHPRCDCYQVSFGQNGANCTRQVNWCQISISKTSNERKILKCYLPITISPKMALHLCPAVTPFKSRKSLLIPDILRWSGFLLFSK